MTECSHKSCSEPAVVRVDIPDGHQAFACVNHREQFEWAIREGNREARNLGWTEDAQIVVLEAA